MLFFLFGPIRQLSLTGYPFFFFFFFVYFAWKSTGPRFHRHSIRGQYVNCMFSQPWQSHLSFWYFFQHQHKHYNTLLNRLKTDSSLPTHVGSPLDYNHRYLIDSFYAAEGNDKEKIRVTRDEKTGTTLECMRKLRLGNLNIYSPKNAADWRVSVNLEIPSTFNLLSFLSIWIGRLLIFF